MAIGQPALEVDDPLPKRLQQAFDLLFVLGLEGVAVLLEHLGGQRPELGREDLGLLFGVFLGVLQGLSGGGEVRFGFVFFLAQPALILAENPEILLQP